MLLKRSHVLVAFVHGIHGDHYRGKYDDIDDDVDDDVDDDS